MLRAARIRQIPSIGWAARARLVVITSVIASLLLAVAPHQPVAVAATPAPPPANQGGWVKAFGTNGVGRIHDSYGGPRVAVSDGRGGVFAALAETGAGPVVVHMTSMGVQDTTYGTNGRAALAGFAYVFSLVRVGGRLVVIGSDAKPWESPGALRVLRLTANGRPDPAFHGGIPIALAPEQLNPLGAAGTLLADGRIAIAVADHVVIVTTTGGLDPTSGQAGIIDTALPGRPAIAARANGYVVGGHVLRQDNPAGFEDLFTVRLLAHTSPGVVDAGFGDNGRVDIADDRIPDEGLEALAVSSADVIVGTTGAMFRLTNTGARHPNFATDAPGVADLALQDDGKIIAIGHGIARFTSNGRLDPTFGSGGRVSAYLNTWQSDVNGGNSWDMDRLIVTGKLIQTVGMADGTGNGYPKGFDLAVATRSGAHTGGVAVMNIFNSRLFERPTNQWMDVVRVQFDRIPEQRLQINFALIDNSAQGLADFGFTNSTVDYTFANGLALLLPLIPLDDGIREPIEQIGIRITGAHFAVVGTKSTANILVVDDSGPKTPPPSLAAFTDAYRGFSGGAFVAAGDLDGDGRAEVITGADAGGGPHVRVLRVNKASGTLVSVADFFAYDSNFTGGVRVATGDVDGDGRNEVITAPGPGGGPHVRVWRLTGSGVTEVASFMAGDPSATSGLQLATGEYSPDGRDEVVTAFGIGGSPDVGIYRVASGSATRVAYFDSSWPTFKIRGTTVAAAQLSGYDIKGDSFVTGPLAGYHTVIGQTGVGFQFNPYGTDDAGVTLSAGTVGTAGNELLTTPTAGRVPEITVWSALWDSPRAVYRFLAYETGFRGGVRMAIGDVDADGSAEIITAPGPGRPTTIIVRSVPLH